MVLSMDRWVGKVAIVTGATSGIGKAIAEELVKQGLKVVGVGRRVELIEAAAKNLEGSRGKLYSFKANLSREEDILEIFKWVMKNVGPVSVLINNAGKGKEGNLMDAPTEVFKTILDLNVMALCIATREAIAVMKTNKINGHIIHIGSVGGHIVPNFPNLNVYPASKHAVRALTETLRQELAREGSKIRVTEISPGGTVTEGTSLNPNNTPERNEIWKLYPLIEPENIADGVVYVLSTPEHVQVHELMIKPLGEPM